MVYVLDYQDGRLIQFYQCHDPFRAAGAVRSPNVGQAPVHEPLGPFHDNKTEPSTCGIDSQCAGLYGISLTHGFERIDLRLGPQFARIQASFHSLARLGGVRFSLTARSQARCRVRCSTFS